MYATYELCGFVSDVRVTVANGVARVSKEAGTVIPLMAGKLGFQYFQYLFSRRQTLEDAAMFSPEPVDASSSVVTPARSATASGGLNSILWSVFQTALLSTIAALCRDLPAL